MPTVQACEQTQTACRTNGSKEGLPRCGSGGGHRYASLGRRRVQVLLVDGRFIFPIDRASAPPRSNLRERDCRFRTRVGIPGARVPEIILTDQGSQLDGEEFRGFCKHLDIDKRHTTPYHPQCDGMAERNIGLVKQVISCLMLDRQLAKGSWPALLKEVSFHCNSMDNASSRISPFMITYGRQPRSPVDAWCRGLELGKRNSHGEYVDSLKNKQAEMNAIAQENIARSLERARELRNKGRVESIVAKGDMVMVRNNARHDSLDPRFYGPYEVMDRKGPDVKIRIPKGNKWERGGELQYTRYKKKWVHLDRCKQYSPAPQLGTPPKNPDYGTPEQELGASVAADSLVEEGNLDDVLASDRDIQLDARQEDHDESVESTDYPREENSPTRGERRYPSRVRKPTRLHVGFVRWDRLSKGFREKSSLPIIVSPRGAQREFKGGSYVTDID